MRNGTRLSGRRLGRPAKDPEVTSAHKQQLRSDPSRRNEGEGVFGSGKCKYSLDLIMHSGANLLRFGTLTISELVEPMNAKLLAKSDTARRKSFSGAPKYFITASLAS
jgi:hypothetical protein